MRNGVGAVEHRTEHPVRARQGPERRDERVVHPRDEEAAEAAVAVGHAERRVAGAGELAGALDERLQDLVDRLPRGDGQHRVADGAQRGAHAGPVGHAADDRAGRAPRQSPQYPVRLS